MTIFFIIYKLQILNEVKNINGEEEVKNINGEEVDLLHLTYKFDRRPLLPPLKYKKNKKIEREWGRKGQWSGRRVQDTCLVFHGR